MKTGRSLQDLAAEIERQAASKRDFVASTKLMTPVVVGEKEVQLELANTGRFPVKPIAHQQIGEVAGIPKPYYDRMLQQAPHLLATNIDEWFKRFPAAKMARTLDGGLRALLSDKFAPLDHYDLCEAVMPTFLQQGLDIKSCEVTETKLYIKAVHPRLERDVPVGHRMGDGTHTIFDTCAPVVIVSNSEVGFGRMTVETGVYTRACTNLALWSDTGMKRTHVGARHKVLDGVENIDHLLSDKTKRKGIEALFMAVADVVNAAFDAGQFEKRVERLAATAEAKIEGKLDTVMEVTAQRFGLNDGERESVFKRLIEGGNLTRYGLHAAITRAAQDVADYDRATELEYLGGKVIELSRGDWQSLNEAAPVRRREAVAA